MKYNSKGGLLKNLKIRKIIEQSRFKHYEIAEAMGINETSFSRLLRKELSESKFTEILNTIKNLTSSVKIEG